MARRLAICVHSRYQPCIGLTHHPVNALPTRAANSEASLNGRRHNCVPFRRQSEGDRACRTVRVPMARISAAGVSATDSVRASKSTTHRFRDPAIGWRLSEAGRTSGGEASRRWSPTALRPRLDCEYYGLTGICDPRIGSAGRSWCRSRRAGGHTFWGQRAAARAVVAAAREAGECLPSPTAQADMVERMPADHISGTARASSRYVRPLDRAEAKAALGVTGICCSRRQSRAAEAIPFSRARRGFPARSCCRGAGRERRRRAQTLIEERGVEDKVRARRRAHGEWQGLMDGGRRLRNMAGGSEGLAKVWVEELASGRQS